MELSAIQHINQKGLAAGDLLYQSSKLSINLHSYGIFLGKVEAL